MMLLLITTIFHNLYLNKDQGYDVVLAVKVNGANLLEDLKA